MKVDMNSISLNARGIEDECNWKWNKWKQNWLQSNKLYRYLNNEFNDGRFLSFPPTENKEMIQKNMMLTAIFTFLNAI